VGTDVARLDNARPYTRNKGGHRETFFSVRVSCISVSNSFLRHFVRLIVYRPRVLCFLLKQNGDDDDDA